MPASAAAATSNPTTALQRAGLMVVTAHGVLLGFSHWLLYRLFVSRTLADLEPPLRAAFTYHTARAFGAEIAILTAAAATILAVRIPLRIRADPRRVAAAGLLSYAAVVLYGVGVVAAIAFGWEPDVFVMSSADATNGQIVAAIAEALPLVLQPLAWGRLAATAASAVLFALLQWRWCGVTAGAAAATAAAAGLAAGVAQVLVLGAPEAL